MEFNISSFYEGEESSSQLNSTALNQNQSQKEQKEEWKVSPIFNSRSKSFKSPLKVVNGTESGYESKSFSTPPQETKQSDLSSFIANKSQNPFDSIIVDSLHKSINFSPRVVFSQEAPSSSAKSVSDDGDLFKWSVEHLAVLKPAYISEDEIAANYHSPIPEVEERIQEVLNEYWSKNVSYIPSPDGPRFINIENRDGSVLTLQTGTGSQLVHDLTPSLCKMIRKKEALKVAYATSSPKQRPRRQVKQMRNRHAQTEVTIPPSSEIDLKKILGDAFVYNPEEEEDNEEVFNVSMCSNLSTRRRLFSATEQGEDDDEGVQNSSMVSCDNLDDSQRFNDSLSPVRKDEQMEQDLSMVSKSHISQIAINISVLNDCMMHSLSQEEPDEEEEEKEEEEENDENNQVFHNENHHMHENEYALHDESTAASATPRHEDLDWTPRRRLPTTYPSSSNTPSSTEVPSRHAQMRKFMYEMSPIHPNKRFTPPPSSS